MVCGFAVLSSISTTSLTISDLPKINGLSALSANTYGVKTKFITIASNNVIDFFII